jgi:1,2-diacylglycerol 3-alpha-glucosyltransferase
MRLIKRMQEEKIKLLLVADTYHPRVDGTLMFMDEFLNRAKSDFDISLFVPGFKEQKDSKSRFFFKVSKIFKLSGYQSFALSWKNLTKLIKAIKTNELIFVQGPAIASYLTMFFAKRQKKYLATYIHVITWELFEKFINKLPKFIYTPTMKLFRWLTVRLYNQCDVVFVPYHDLKEKLESLGVKTKIEVAKLGVDIERFKETKDLHKSKKKVKIDEKKTVIGYVGRISQEKNVLTLVKAFKQLPNQQDLHLLIVGDGQKGLVNEIKKTRNCTVTKFVNNVEDYLKAMDIFVMPSLTETTSLATLEAMATGLPIIATKVGFIKRYIIKNYNGVFFPRESPTHLTLKLEMLLSEKHLQEKLGKNARKTVAYSFSWERSINKIRKLLVQNFLEKDEKISSK